MSFQSKKTIIHIFTIVLMLLTLVMPKITAVSFEWAPLDPLFREPLADAFANSTSFRLLKVTDDAGVPDTVLVANSETNRYETLAYDDRSLRDYWHMKSAVNIGILRLSFDIMQLEGYIQGGLNTVFQKEGSINSLGFDGMYGAGITFKVFDTVAVSGGFHHFSGHWGDEILVDLLETHPDLDVYSSTATRRLVEYTRGNSWLVGISVEIPAPLRWYVFAELPMTKAWIRPGIHVPPHSLKPGTDTVNQFDNITAQEGLSGLSGYDASYKAWRLQTGAEIRVPISNIGSIFAAGEVQAHQDGKTLHQVGGYDRDNPWEFEYTVGGGFEFNLGRLKRKFRFELYYHDGRFPLLNYFFQRSRYLVMGIAISG
ncbi:MAG: hypothetical protein RBT04_03190 [Sphaerochaetaceae bacterium]|nr:hypothetical protein [Sphaerochaetaceae bacterium]